MVNVTNLNDTPLKEKDKVRIHTDWDLSDRMEEDKKKSELELLQLFRYEAIFTLVASTQYNIGLCYELGKGVVQSYNSAVIWYKMAAKQNHALAQNNLGVCYEKGNGVPQSYKEAFECYKAAAEQGDALAQYHLLLCYEDGKGMKQSHETVIIWYEQTANQGDAWAQFHLGWCYEHGKGVKQSDEKAFYWYEKAAKQQNPRDQFYLGLCYEKGKGVEKSNDLAMSWYELAAEQGYADAQINLGILYAKRRYFFQKDMLRSNDLIDSPLFDFNKKLYVVKTGEKPPSEMAFELFEEAAKQGNARALFCLGLCYEKGKGTPINYKEAVQCYMKATEKGHIRAYFHLGLCYELGMGIDISYKQAIACYKKVAKQNNTLVFARINELQKILDQPNADKKNTSINDLIAVAKDGDLEAQFRLGTHYEQGDIIKVSFKKALYWYEQAANLGHAEAKRKVADAYFYGKGTIPEMNLAKGWYLQLEANNDAEIHYQLGCCDAKKAYTYASKHLNYHLLADSDEWKRAENNHFRKLYEFIDRKNKEREMNMKPYNVEEDDDDIKEDGFDEMGYDKNGYDKYGYDKNGYDRRGYDEDGYDKYGYDKDDYCRCDFSEGFDYQDGDCTNESICFDIDDFYDGENSMSQGYFEDFFEQQEREDAEHNAMIDNLHSRAFAWFEKAAQKGHVLALAQVASCYSLGEGVSLSRETTFAYCEKLADAGIVEFGEIVAACYEYGFGVTQSYETAYAYYKKFANEGTISYQYKVGLCYYEGKGVQKSSETAIEWFQKAAQSGDADAHHQLGVCYENGIVVAQSYEDAIVHFNESNDLHDTYKVAEYYYHGEVVPKNLEKAFDSYNKVASYYEKKLDELDEEQKQQEDWIGNYDIYYENDAEKEEKEDLDVDLYDDAHIKEESSRIPKWAIDALFKLGTCYEEGYQAEKSDNQAFYWYLKAAQEGHAKAQRMTSLFYQKGRGVDYNIPLGLSYLRRSATQGDVEALLKIAAFFYTGEGVKKNYEKSFSLFALAAKRGSTFAEKLLSECYIDENVCMEEAFARFQQLKDTGSLEIQSLLRQPARREGTRKAEIERRLEWFIKIVRDANESRESRIDAHYKIALIHMHDVNILNSMHEGISWCKKAAEYKHLKAARMLNLYVMSVYHDLLEKKEPDKSELTETQAEDAFSSACKFANKKNTDIYNHEKAIHFFALAATFDHKQAKEYLCRLYFCKERDFK
ncbi:MAG: tetratricopeptide repeat protein [Bacillota bacterium]